MPEKLHRRPCPNHQHAFNKKAAAGRELAAECTYCPLIISAEQVFLLARGTSFDYLKAIADAERDWYIQELES